MKMPRLVLALLAATVLATLSVGSAVAGEITGNGTVKGVNGNSECSFSGQEDLQWFEDDAQEVRKEVATRGDPGHAQSWGQARPIWDILIGLNLHPGQACNPARSGGLH